MAAKNEKTDIASDMLRLLSACSVAVSGAEDEKGLLDGICRAIAEKGYPLVCAYVRDAGPCRQIIQLSRHGTASEYFRDKAPPWEDAAKRNFSAGGTGTFSGGECAEDGIGAMFSAPFADAKGDGIGILNIYGGNDGISKTEAEAFDIIARAAGRGISSIRTENERKSLLARVRENEISLERLLKFSGDGIWELALSKGTYGIDEGNFKFTAKRNNKHSAHSIQDIVSAEDAPLFISKVKDFTSKKNARFDFISAHGNGQYILLLAVGREKKEDAFLVTGIYENITELMKFNEIKEGLEFRQVLLDSIPFPFCYKNADLKYLGCNMAFEAFTGCDRKDIIGREASDIFPAPIAAQENNIEAELLEKPGAKALEKNIQLPSGEARDFIETKSVYYAEDGTPGGIISSYTDITDMKRTREELDKSQECYRTLAEFASDMIYLINKENRFQYLSPSCLEFTGFSIAEFMENPALLDRIVYADDKDVWYSHIKDSGIEYMPVEFRIVTKKGVIKWVRHTYKSVIGKNGEKLGRRGSYSDITLLMELERELINARNRMSEKVKEATAGLSEINRQLKEEIETRKATGESLRQSEKRFRTIAEASPVALLIVRSSDNAVLFINPQALKLFQIDPETVSGINIPDFYADPEDRKKLYHELSITGRIENQELQLKKKDGSVFYALVSLISGHYQDEKVVYASLFDITEQKMVEKNLANTIREFQTEIIARKAAEKAMFERDEDYRLLFENMTSGFALHEIICDGAGNPADYRFLEINPAFEKLTGLKAGEIVGKKVSEVIPGIEREWIETYGQVALSGRPVSFENYSGALDKYFSIFAFSPKKNQFATMFNDISERKIIENALKESEKQYRKLTETVQIGIWQLSTDGRILFVNPKMMDMLEIKNIDEIGDRNCFSFISNENIEIIRQEHDRLSNGFLSNYEAKLLSTKGKELEVIVTGLALFSDKGQFQSYIESFTDITDRKKAEREIEQHRLQLIQADKMASLGVLVSGVAHEINNPTNFIMLNAPILYDTWKSILPALDEYVKTQGDFSIAGLPYSEMRGLVPSLFNGVLEGAERIKNIVGGLKNYARHDSAMLDEIVDINDVIHTSLTLLSNMIKKATDRLLVNCNRNIPPVKGNFQRLEQVVINLIENSCQAIKSKDKRLSVSTDIAPDGKVLLKVEDEGIGIPEKDMPRILDPFFTTKRDSGGTGLGLAISVGMLKDMKAEISFSSKVGEGTVVTVLFPPYIDNTEE